MKNSNLLQVGDKVMWRGAFGTAPAVEATVIGLEWCDWGQKEGGKQLDEIDWDKANTKQLIIEFSNGHYARGIQISKI